jgi:hypothetical protein
MDPPKIEPTYKHRKEKKYLSQLTIASLIYFAHNQTERNTIMKQQL